MGKTELKVEIDADLLAQARADGLDLDAVTEAAVRHALKPNDPVLLFGAGSAAYVDRRPQDASSHLRRALEFNPRLTGASRLLGELAYADGDVAQAITIYEKALKHAPDDPHLAKRLAAWRTDADVHRDFDERQLGRFKVMF